MENYILKENEVVFYKGQVSRKNQKGSTEIILTNIKLVFINKHKKLFAKENVIIEEYNINKIKYFNNTPQVFKKGNLIEIYLLGEEIFFTFNSRNESKKFFNSLLNYLTNKTTFQRTVEKINSTIATVDETLEIDSKQIAGNVIKNGMVGNISKTISKIGISFFNKNKK